MVAKHSSDVTDSTAVEAPDLETAASDAPKHGFFIRLYTGTGAFDVIGHRKQWFFVTGLIVAIAIAAIAIRGFTFGIDFEGGTTVSMPAAGVVPSPPSRSKTSTARRRARVPNGGDGRQRRFGHRADPLGNA